MTVSHALAVVSFLGWIGAGPGLMKFTTVDHGDRSRIEQPRNVVVRTEVEWATLWKEHAGKGKPPAVDLTRSILVGVFLGTRQSAGYTVKITGIEEQGAGVVVTYREQAPAPDAMVAQVLTAPFHLVRTESRTGPVTFQRAR